MTVVTKIDAQSNKSEKPLPSTLSIGTSKDSVPQKDVMDLVDKVFKLKTSNKSDSAQTQPGKILLSVFPAFGYALQSGEVAILAINVSFYTAGGFTNLSSITFNPQYSVMHQVVLPLIASVWNKNNTLNFLGDWRFYKYPSYTYGLGSRTLLSKVDSLDYSYIKFYQEVLGKIGYNLYAGGGYDLDYHYDIKDYGNSTNFDKYNAGKTTTVSSGLIAHIKYDTRKNVNNPKTAFYASASYRYNSTILGSNNNWQAVQIEIKKYYKLTKKGNNILAFWSWNEFTFGRKPPYLDLPSTGWDTYNNTGRGYIQGRFRGANMAYLESEFRFNILKNGLLGGVIFSNAEAVSRNLGNNKNIISPGEGAGIRIKLNRYSDTNLAVDYGFGTGGSRGVFFNIGEVF
ncbi:MAG TPA: hypothetical protein VNG53_06480 [Bacteroidia bacterium]|nr:hypothetical protein [Bacteroidia bacterium]